MSTFSMNSRRFLYIVITLYLLYTNVRSENCTFCVNGKRTAFKRFGNGNGCGTDLIAPVLNPFVPQYEGCCNKHDQCYENCAKTKIECDLLFLQCLESVQKGAFVVMARSALKGHYACDAYVKAQQNRCKCFSASNEHFI